MTDWHQEAVAAAHYHHDMLDPCKTLKTLGYWPAYLHQEAANIGGYGPVAYFHT